MPMGGAVEGVLAAAQEGAELALAALYREVHPGLLRYIGSQTPDNRKHLAADVWLAAASGLRRFEGDERAFPPLAVHDRAPASGRPTRA
jgi:RNA polymerase sigma-70 factor (ECF subfamily)